MFILGLQGSMVTDGWIIRHIFAETVGLIIEEFIIHTVRIKELFNRKSHSWRGNTINGVPAVKELFVLGFDFLITDYCFRILFSSSG